MRRVPWRLGVQPLLVRTPTPTLGQHNEFVLGGMLGLDRGELDSLAEQGIIGTKPRLR